MKKELVPHVDKNDNQIGVVDRATAYKQGLTHRGVHAFIQNNEGKYLIQQRSDSKSTWPGCYDLSVAETLRPDEAYTAALTRGLKEELDLSVPTADFQSIKESYYQEFFWNDYKIFGMVCLYSIMCSKQPKFLDGEVKSVEWLTKEEVSDLVLKQPESCTPWLLHDWQLLNSAAQ